MDSWLNCLAWMFPPKRHRNPLRWCKTHRASQDCNSKELDTPRNRRSIHMYHRLPWPSSWSCRLSRQCNQEQRCTLDSNKDFQDCLATPMSHWDQSQLPRLRQQTWLSEWWSCRRRLDGNPRIHPQEQTRLLCPHNPLEQQCSSPGTGLWQKVRDVSYQKFLIHVSCQLDFVTSQNSCVSHQLTIPFLSYF